MRKSNWPNVLARKRSPFSLLVKFWSRVRFLLHAIWCKISPTRYKTSLHDKSSAQIRNGINVLKCIPQMKFHRIYPSRYPIGFNGVAKYVMVHKVSMFCRLSSGKLSLPSKAHCSISQWQRQVTGVSFPMKSSFLSNNS